MWLCWVLLSTLLGWLVCREGVKVPLTNTAGVQRARLLVSQPRDPVLHGLSGSCGLSCPLEAGGWAVPALPWACAGVPVSPRALESAERLCASFKRSLPAAGNHIPNAGGAGWGGLVCRCLGSISLTTSCKPSWGRFLLRFLPPAVLPAPALGCRQCPPVDVTQAKGTDAVAGAATRGAGEGLRSTRSAALVTGPDGRV